MDTYEEKGSMVYPTRYHAVVVNSVIILLECMLSLLYRPHHESQCNLFLYKLIAVLYLIGVSSVFLVLICDTRKASH